jgi:hypothetical protein
MRAYMIGSIIARTAKQPRTMPTFLAMSWPDGPELAAALSRTRRMPIEGDVVKGGMSKLTVPCKCAGPVESDDLKNGDEKDAELPYAKSIPKIDVS